MTVETVVDLAAKPCGYYNRCYRKRMGDPGRLVSALRRRTPFQAVMEWVSERLFSHASIRRPRLPLPLEAIELRSWLISILSRSICVPRMLFEELQRTEQTLAKRITDLAQVYGDRLGRLFMV